MRGLRLPIPPLRAVTLAVLLLATAAGAGAQPVRRLETGFERDVNRYRWTATTQLEQGVAGWDVALENRFTSDAFLLFENRLSFRDENALAWRADRPMGDRFSTRLRGRSAWYTQSRVFSQEVYGGLRYQVRPYAWLEPALGVAWDRRPGIAETPGEPPLRMDAGPAYGLRLEAAPPSLGGYRVRLHGDGAWQVITPRRGHAVQLGGEVRRDFEAARLSAAFGLSNFRRDAYQAVSFLNRGVPTDRLSETVEATDSDTLRARLALEAPLFRGLRLTTSMDASANQRMIRTLHAPANALFFDTNFGRRAIDAEAALVYEQPQRMLRLAVRSGAEIEERELTNREHLPPTQAAQKSALLQQADYDQGLFELQARGRVTFGRAVLSFDGASSIVRHDTPEANLDDRDELYHNAQVGALMALSRYLEVDVRLFGTYYHTVYLNAERSAENNVQRSLRLTPRMRWTPSPRTELELRPEIRATYTVDDFLLPGRRPSDQSARELRYDGALDHDFGGGVRLRVNGSYSDLHLGRLLWERFSEIPFDTLRTYSGWIRLQAGRRATAEVGLRFFIRSDFDRAAIVRYPRLADDGTPLRDEEGRVLRSTITRPGRKWIEQVGPTCAITWPLRDASAVRLQGWLNVQTVRHRLYGDLPDALAPRIQAAARDGTRRIFPNVALSVLWNL